MEKSTVLFAIGLAVLFLFMASCCCCFGSAPVLFPEDTPEPTYVPYPTRTPAPQAEPGDISVGETVYGEYVEGRDEIWLLSLSESETVDIDLIAEDDDWDTFLEVWEADGWMIADDDDSGNGYNSRVSQLELPPGDYEIHVMAFSGEGEYALSVERAEAAQVIEYGEIVSGRIESGEQDWWEFEGQAVDAIRISMVGLGDFSDTYLELYDDGDMWLTSDDDSGEGLFADIRGFVLPETGTYRIAARGYGDRGGEYELTLERFEAAAERTIAYGETQTGELSHDVPEEYWSFEGNAGDAVSISMVGLGALSDTYLELYDSSGGWLTSDDDSGDGLSAFIGGFILPETGTYRILARPYSAGEGMYELTLELTVIEEHTIAYGETASAELTTDSPQAHWSFEGNAGDIVSISMVSPDGYMDTFLELYDPNGNLLAQDDDSGGDLSALIGNVVLPESGTYRIVARTYGGGVGVYDLSLIQVKEQTIAYGQTLAGLLTEAEREDLWTFAGGEGDLISLSMVGLGDLDDTCLTLYDMDGVMLVSDDNSGKGNFARIEGYVLPISGTYRIAASAICDWSGMPRDIPYGSEMFPYFPQVSTGPYSLSLRRIEEGVVAYGQTVAGALTEESTAGYWRFDGTAGQVVDVSVEGVDGLTDTYVELCGAGGDLLAQDDDSGAGYAALIERFILPETGSYRIVVRAFDERPGGYRLTLRQ
ncbi:MAG: PPC domain-containing protein, partial [Anaerolineae bacterium]|nr:PPC domain-containing protein [Anaerolineae bacterium]